MWIIGASLEAGGPPSLPNSLNGPLQFGMELQKYFDGKKEFPVLNKLTFNLCSHSSHIKLSCFSA